MAKNPWWFHPKLYIIVLWASLAAQLVHPLPAVSGFLWVWIGYGMVVALLGIKNMARRCRSANSA
jgi:hypothetical protein